MSINWRNNGNEQDVLSWTFAHIPLDNDEDGALQALLICSILIIPNGQRGTGGGGGKLYGFQYVAVKASNSALVDMVMDGCLLLEQVL